MLRMATLAAAQSARANTLQRYEEAKKAHQVDVAAVREQQSSVQRAKAQTDLDLLNDTTGHSSNGGGAASAAGALAAAAGGAPAALSGILADASVRQHLPRLLQLVPEIGSMVSLTR